MDALKTDAERTQAFEAQRPRLMRLAYRMLGSVTEAEDVLQDAWLRWTRATNSTGGGEIAEPAAWLVRAATRLCIDRLRAAKAERERYRGPWLPEPLVEPLIESPAAPLERAEDVSVAFLLALERLSPLERAVFLLHDVFEEDYGAVARTLDRTEAAVRQLASRAREHLRQAKPRFAVDPATAQRLVTAFAAASNSADFSGLAALLAEDAVMVTDAGGKRPAAVRVLVGRDDILRLLQGLHWRHGLPPVQRLELARINGAPGLVMHLYDGPQTLALEPDADGRIAAIYIVRNPDKLTRLGG